MKRFLLITVIAASATIACMTSFAQARQQPQQQTQSQSRPKPQTQPQSRPQPNTANRAVDFDKAFAEIAGKVGKYGNQPVKEMKSFEYHNVEYKVYPLKNGKKDVGAVVKTSATGYAGPIVILVGFNAKANIVAYTVLEQNETPRWGAVVGEWFQKGGNVIGLNPGHGDLKLKSDGGQVDGITGSTITSKAFLHAINSAYKVWQGKQPEKQAVRQGGHYGGHGAPRPGQGVRPTPGASAN